MHTGWYVPGDQAPSETNTQFHFLAASCTQSPTGHGCASVAGGCREFTIQPHACMRQHSCMHAPTCRNRISIGNHGPSIRSARRRVLHVQSHTLREKRLNSTWATRKRDEFCLDMAIRNECLRSLTSLCTANSMAMTRRDVRRTDVHARRVRENTLEDSCQ